MTSSDAIRIDPNHLAGGQRPVPDGFHRPVGQLDDMTSTVTALGLGALIASASAEDDFVLCPFRRCTGGYCPGCGATRSANRLARGDFAESWAHHPWVMLAAAQLIVVAAIGMFLSAEDRRHRLGQLAIPVLLANAILLIGIWIVRLAGHTIPTGWL
jgi:hypothetical protein